MRNWWNGLSQGWQQKLGKDIQLGGGIALSQVSSYNDTAAMIGGQKSVIDQGAYYAGLNQDHWLEKN